jgi:serine/threonine protein kinase
MNGASIKVEADESLESLVGQVADEFLRRQRDGDHPDVEEYIARYPQAADVLRPVLASLGVLHLSQSGHAASPAETDADVMAGTLGDFRLFREIGRGGMGVVYEAEQISLGRRVALKVLPFAAALDAKQLQRFKNEAQAAAHLHHTNIVPVFGVGCERSVHYYAMQYVEGQTLALVIRDLRQQAGLDKGNPVPVGAASDLASALASGRWAPPPHPYPSPPQQGRGVGVRGAAVGEPTASNASSAADQAAPSTLHAAVAATQPGTAISSERSVTNPAFFRTVAHLGIQAAEALEHAHQLGVIHRDIKPGNLLLETTSPLSPPGRGAASEGVRLWITDFGLAQIQGDAKLTLSGDLLGTLRYMSPEQALGQRLAIDHRTDLYSLGATLYELLTLEPVFPGEDRQGLLRQIASEEPRPLRRLNKAIPAELETIVLKLLEKSRADRYATAQEVADDLRRYLEDRPIRARRPGIVARVRKWSWRHRGAVWAAAVSAAIVLTATAGVIAWQWRAAVDANNLAEKRRIDAEEARDEAKAINEFFVKNLLGAASPEEALGSKLTVEAVLDKAANKIDGAFPDQPKVEATVRMAIGETYVNLGLYQKAEPHLRRAIKLRREALGEEDPGTLDSMNQMGRVLGFQERQAEAEVLLREALVVARRALGDEHLTTLGLLHTLAEALNDLGRLPEAETLERKCLAIQRHIRGSKDETTLSTLRSLAECLVLEGKWDEAEGLARDCLDIGKEALPKDHPIVMTGRDVLVYVLTWEGKTRELEPVALENLQAATRVWGPNHPKRWRCVIYLAIAYYLQGKFKDAERLADEVFRSFDSGERGQSLVVLGLVYRGQGHWAEAEQMLRQAVGAHSGIRGPENSVTFFQLCALGTVLQALGKRAEACTALRAALDGRRKVVPASPFLAESLHAWAEFLMEEGEIGEAEKALREALEIERQAMPTRHRDTGQTLAALGWALTRQGRAGDGEPLLREGLELCRTGYPLGHWPTADAQIPQLDWATATAESRLGGCLTVLGQFADAEKLLLSSYQTLQGARGTPPQRRVEAVDRIVNLYETWGKADKAAEWRAKRPVLPKPPEKGAAPSSQDR